MSMSVSALNIGGMTIYFGTTKIGNGLVYNNESFYPDKEPNRTITAETNALQKYDEVQAQVWYSYYDSKKDKVVETGPIWHINQNAAWAKATITVTSSQTPIDAFARFVISDVRRTFQKAYNFG